MHQLTINSSLIRFQYHTGYVPRSHAWKQINKAPRAKTTISKQLHTNYVSYHILFQTFRTGANVKIKCTRKLKSSIIYIATDKLVHEVDECPYQLIVQDRKGSIGRGVMAPSHSSNLHRHRASLSAVASPSRSTVHSTVSSAGPLINNHLDV